MEPFVSRDGKYLFFNNSNAPGGDTDLYWAARIDDLTFQLKGEIAGTNSSGLDALASMDSHNNFFFVSTRSYFTTFSTIYSGVFADGAVSGIALVPGISRKTPGYVNFDAEVSADGNTLYYDDGYFGTATIPKTARIKIAHRSSASFVRDPIASRRILATVNLDGLNYAPDTSVSELEIFFTRLNRNGAAIYTAGRSSTSEPFGPATKVDAITGFSEGPSISPDAKSLYYHTRIGGRFVIYRVTRD